jgi:2'-5' RNA ligase
MIDYARLEFDKETASNLFNFCLEHRLGVADVDDQSKVSLDDFKFHVTVIYSRTTHPDFHEGDRDFKPHILQPDAFDLFGPDKDLLVLKIQCDTVLLELNEHYKATYGHVSDYTPYRPHLTIRGPISSVRDRIKEIPLPEFELRADRLIHKIKIA